MKRSKAAKKLKARREAFKSVDSSKRPGYRLPGSMNPRKQT